MATRSRGLSHFDPLIESQPLESLKPVINTVYSTQKSHRLIDFSS